MDVKIHDSIAQEYAEEFEKSYLMLAEIYVGRGKFDLAQELCKKCLGYNKSCAGAWDLMGVIMEKEASYKDAAECYEKSWAFEVRKLYARSEVKS